jgi:hypothetical protein
MPPSNWQQKINKANDDLHEAVNDMLMSDDVDVTTKVHASEKFKLCFHYMSEAKVILGLTP